MDNHQYNIGPETKINKLLNEYIGFTKSVIHSNRYVVQFQLQYQIICHYHQIHDFPVTDCYYAQTFEVG